jgi:RNA polymerase sigma-70 factor (ECF subfamily)
VPPPDAADRSQREQRFGDLYQRHYALIRAYARRRIWSPEDAADAVAETFTIAWRRIGDVPAPPADRLWLYGVARRVITGGHRSADRRRNLLVRLISRHGEAAEVAPGTDPASAALLEALSRLRPADREALQLVVWDGLSHAEAAQVLECSANAVAIRVHRAKARLRADLSGTLEAGRPPTPHHAVPVVDATHLADAPRLADAELLPNYRNGC